MSCIPVLYLSKTKKRPAQERGAFFSLVEKYPVSCCRICAPLAPVYLSGNSLRASCNDLFPFPKAVRATGRYVLRRAQHFSAIFCGVQGGKALNAQQQRFLQQKRSGRGGGAAYGSKAVYDSGAANGSKAVCGDFFTTAVFPCTEGLLDSTKRARPQARSF